MRKPKVQFLKPALVSYSRKDNEITINNGEGLEMTLEIIEAFELYKQLQKTLILSGFLQ